jgi:hypothetical protein
MPIAVAPPCRARRTSCAARRRARARTDVGAGPGCIKIAAVTDTHVIALPDGREIWIEPVDESDREQCITMRTPGDGTVELESHMDESGRVRWSLPPSTLQDENAPDGA